MKKVNRISLLLALGACLLIITPKNAYAYLDPGTGSFILQLLIATLIGTFFSIKLFGKRIVSFIKGLFSKKKVN